MYQWKRCVFAGLALAGCQDGAGPSSSTADETTAAAATTTTGDVVATTTTTITTGTSAAPGSTTDEAVTEPGETTAAEPPPPVQGLRATYYATYLDRVIERVDPTLDFDWGDGAPGEGLAADRFSIRWSGSLIPPETGTYTIASETDDGVRVWVGDALVIDDWNGHFVERNEASVALEAGVATPVRVEYFEYDLAASARLLWSREGVAEEVIPAAHLLAAEADELGPPKPPYANPVVPFDCPDPGVLGVDEPSGPAFYMVCTGGSFPIRRSRDLVLWSDTGAAVLPKGKPAWAANGNRNWAPELHRVGEQYIAYFTTVNGANVLSIGAAHAAAPTGPYTETGGPLVEHPMGVIDATYFDDGDKHYLIYKIDGNSQGKPTPILLRELAPDGLSFADGSAEVQLLVNQGATWEGGVVEAQWLIRRDGMYFMFYSGNVYDHRYRTGVARAASVLGPYEKFGPPILGNNERWVGPGHGSVVSIAGLDYFVYHAWTNAGNGTQSGDAGRQVLVDRIVWDQSWPKIHDGSPSRSQQLWPGVP